MNIVHVITRFVRGGADENTLITCNAQVAGGDRVHLVHGAEFSAEMIARLDPRVEVHEVPALARPVRPVGDLAALLALVRLMAALKPDIVHTHTSKAGALGRVAAWITGAPMVVHGVHILPFDNVPPLEKLAYLSLERALAPITHAFVNVSEGMQAMGLRHGVGRAERHFVVPSGMDVGLFRNARAFSPAEREARLGPDATGPLLVFTAALEPRKRQHEFLDVFAAVRARIGDARLVLLGEGHDEARLRRRAGMLGLDGAVHFAGYSDEVHRWIASAAVCVFASEREGLPRAVIQYVLGGRPVVATRLPGIEVAVVDGEGGRLVDVDRMAHMVDPIVAILSDPGLAGRMAGAAQARDLSRWDQTTMASQLQAVYRNTPHRARTAPRGVMVAAGGPS